jgi:hypothetical protein
MVSIMRWPSEELIPRNPDKQRRNPLDLKNHWYAKAKVHLRPSKELEHLWSSTLYQNGEAICIKLPWGPFVSLLFFVPLKFLLGSNTDEILLSVLENESSLVSVVTPRRINRAPTAHHDMICTRITARPERLWSADLHRRVSAILPAPLNI